MISVGSRDGRKGLGLRYGVDGGEMELGTELEEGEACFQNNNGDDSTIDLDVALSYIDEKLQNVLGHFRKDFEGGVSAENLGAKFGGYGSFLPTYQRSPVCPLPKTPPKVLTYNALKSPNNLHIEGGHQNSANASISGASVPAPKGLSMAGKVKQEVPISFPRCGDKLTLNGQKPVNNFANASDQKTLKVRIKVGSDNLSTRKKAEIYSGLGLDDSPSSSLEASPEEGIFHAPQDDPDESISSILEMMTSFPVSGGRLLSPLPYDLLYLTKKKCEDDSCGPVHKGSQESINKFESGKINRNGYEEKKSKSAEKNYCPMKSRNGNDVGVLEWPERGAENLACEELVSNALKLPLLSNNHVVDLGKDAVFNGGLKNELSDMAKEEPLDPVLIRDHHGVEKNSIFPKKVDLDVSKGSKTLDLKPLKKKASQKVTPCEKDTVKLARGKETSSLGGKKSPKESLVLKNGIKNDDYFTSKSMNSASKSHTEVLKKNSGKARETYKKFFGEFDLEQEDDDEMGLEVKPSGDEKSKECYKGKSIQKSTSSFDPMVGNGPVSDATVAPVVNEDWVCCDKCEKWRLLPPGLNPGSLPEKWLCSMLDWLPGMNRCSISEEETTKAITSRFHGPTPLQGSHVVHPFQLGVIPVDPMHRGQRYQNFGSEALSAGVKKKKNVQTSQKSRSLNGANQSLSINEIEFQDSGQSSRLIAEKHKEKKKLRGNFMDEGDNVLQLNIRKKREASQDYSRDSKKVKHGIDEDWASDHGGAIFKASRSKPNDCPKDSKSALKVSVKITENQKQNQMNPRGGTFKMGKSEEKDAAKKRKLNKFEEEISHIDHRKEKKAKLSKSGADKRVTNVKDEQIRSLNVMESFKRNVLPVHAPMAATSSSSKVSSSHKTKPNNQEAKGSPVESVSSSPRKFTSSRTKIGGIDDGEDANGSRQKKNAKGPSSKNKINKVILKNTEPMNENRETPEKSKSKGGRHHSQEKPAANSEKFEKGFAFKKEASGKPLSESAKRDGQLKHGHSLPPPGKGQNEVKIAENLLSVDAGDANGALKGKLSKKTENQNGNQPMKLSHSTSDSPLRRDSSIQAVTNAVKEAKDLKHLADRLKNSGSDLESTALYFQAALKFLHGASLLESHGDMIQSTAMYSSTAKLCEFCAHEYEKSKEMAAAALAYKCTEVAYFKVVYSSHANACKDRNELQAALQIGTTGESPSSSASDLDNINNPATVDKAAITKGVNFPQVAGNHVIPVRNKSNLLRILNYAQDASFAMEASRKSRIAFEAYGSKVEEAHHKESISAVKKALDFNFQDVTGLLRLVRLAMEVINR